MLKFLTKRKRSRNVLLYFFIIAMTGALVGLFTVVVSGNRSIFSGAATEDSAVATVVNYKITVKDLRDGVSAFGRQINQGENTPDTSEMFRTYGSQVLQGLIRNKLVLYEADQLGMTATDPEVKDRIAEQFNPFPSFSEYRQRIQQAGYTVEQFEDGVRSEITQAKLRSFVTAGIEVSDDEVKDDYVKSHTNYDIKWVEVDPNNLKDKVTVSDADLQAYFDQHKKEFHIDTEARRARYIFIDQTKAGETIQVSDDDMRKMFDPERGVKQVRVSEIVLNVPATGKDEEVRKQADSIKDQASGSQGKPAADFVGLVKQYSQDPKTKAKGGDIGWVNKDDKRDSDDPLNNVFTMKKDQVGVPVKKGDKYYILKVTDRKLPTFEESRPQLLKEARAQKAYSRAVDISIEAEKKFKESKSADSVVADLSKQYGPGVVTVKDTPLFVQGDKLPDLGAATNFEDEVFQLAAQGEVGDRLNVQNGFAIPQFTGKQGPHDPAFDEVKSKVEDQCRYEKAKSLALEKANQLAKAQTPDALKSIADSLGLKAEDRAGMSANDSAGPLMTDETKAKVLQLAPGTVTHEPIKLDNSDSYVVEAMVNRKDADMGDAFQKERKSIRDRLLANKQDNTFSSFLESAQKRLTDEGKIKIYQKVIDETMGSAESQGQIPGLPTGGFGGPSRPRPRRAPPIPH